VSGRVKIVLTFVAFTLATPAAAQTPAPPTTAFDGTYAGVSADVSTVRQGRRCPRIGVPVPLTIRNGVIKPPAGTGWTATVGPQGILVVRNQVSQVDAQIDGQGTMKWQYNGPDCIVTYVWRKQSG
jgi:hypothetical protein